MVKPLLEQALENKEIVAKKTFDYLANDPAVISPEAIVEEVFRKQFERRSQYAQYEDVPNFMANGGADAIAAHLTNPTKNPKTLILHPPAASDSYTLIYNVLAENRTITGVKLSGDIGQHAMQTLMNAFKCRNEKNKPIGSLSYTLPRNQYYLNPKNEDDLKTLFHKIPESQIKALDISGRRLQQEAVDSLAVALESNPPLNALRMAQVVGKSQFDKQINFLPLAKALSKNTRLATLSLAGLETDAQFFVELADGLTQKDANNQVKSAITDLDLSWVKADKPKYNPVKGERELPAIGEQVCRIIDAGKVKQLNLQHLKIDKNFVEGLSASLKKLPQGTGLSSLSIGGNFLSGYNESDVGLELPELRVLLKALTPTGKKDAPDGDNLESLSINVYAYSTPSSEIPEFSDYLAKTKNLRHLSYAENHRYDGHILTHFVEGLGQNKSIRSLDFSRMRHDHREYKETHVAWGKLLHAIGDIPTLTRFSPPHGERRFKPGELLEAFQGNPNILRIDGISPESDGTPAFPAYVDKLVQANAPFKEERSIYAKPQTITRKGFTQLMIRDGRALVELMQNNHDCALDLLERVANGNLPKTMGIARRKVTHNDFEAFRERIPAIIDIAENELGMTKQQVGLLLTNAAMHETAYCRKNGGKISIWPACPADYVQEAGNIPERVFDDVDLKAVEPSVRRLSKLTDVEAGNQNHYQKTFDAEGRIISNFQIGVDESLGKGPFLTHVFKKDLDCMDARLDYKSGSGEYVFRPENALPYTMTLRYDPDTSDTFTKSSPIGGKLYFKGKWTVSLHETQDLEEGGERKPLYQVQLNVVDEGFAVKDLNGNAPYHSADRHSNAWAVNDVVSAKHVIAHQMENPASTEFDKTGKLSVPIRSIIGAMVDSPAFNKILDKHLQETPERSFVDRAKQGVKHGGHEH